MWIPFKIKEEEEENPKTLIFWALLSAKLFNIDPKPPKKISFFRKLLCHRVEPKELRGQCPNLQDFKQSLGWGMHFCFFFACLVFEVLQWERWEYVSHLNGHWPAICQQCSGLAWRQHVNKVNFFLVKKVNFPYISCWNRL